VASLEIAMRCLNGGASEIVSPRKGPRRVAG